MKANIPHEKIEISDSLLISELISELLTINTNLETKTVIRFMEISPTYHITQIC